TPLTISSGAAADWVGTVTGNLVVPAAQLLIGAPASATAGTAFSITLTAAGSSGHTVPGDKRTVHFAPSHGQAVHPAAYTCTPADQGTHTFSVTLKTTGGQSLTITGTNLASSSGSVSITVSPPLFAPAVSYTIGTTVYRVAVGDFNGDSKLDL